MTVNNDPEPSPAAAIEDFKELDVSQTGHGRYTVTNRAEGTVYEVRLSEPACSCPDFRYNIDEDDHEACKHLLAANFGAPRTTPAEEWALQQVAGKIRDLQESVTRIEKAASGLEAREGHHYDEPEQEPTAEPETDAQKAQQNGQGREVLDDRVAEVKYWLEEQGAPVEKLRVWEHEDFGSIQIETDGYLEDDEFEAYRNATDHDLVNYDQDDQINYIKADNVAEVVGA